MAFSRKNKDGSVETTSVEELVTLLFDTIRQSVRNPFPSSPPPRLLLSSSQALDHLKATSAPGSAVALTQTVVTVPEWFSRQQRELVQVVAVSV